MTMIVSKFSLATPKSDFFFSIFTLKEEWSLRHKLERAEARIQTLEAQVKKI